MVIVAPDQAPVWTLRIEVCQILCNVQNPSVLHVRHEQIQMIY